MASTHKQSEKCSLTSHLCLINIDRPVDSSYLRYVKLNLYPHDKNEVNLNNNKKKWLKYLLASIPKASTKYYQV